MTATALTTTPTTAPTTTSTLRRTTVVAGLAGAAAVTVAATAAHAAGVSFEIEGEAIPLVGFAQMTFLGAVLGGLLLAVLNRRSRSPHTSFVRATAVLTALSGVPSVAWPDDAATKVTLVALHVLAAVLVVPALARHADA